MKAISLSDRVLFVSTALPFKHSNPAFISHLAERKSRLSSKAIPSLPTALLKYKKSENQKSNIWNHKFIQSIKSDTMQEIYQKMAERYKDKVKGMFDERVGISSRLELIELVQRLGVAYHFEKEIKSTLDTIILSKEDSLLEDLYTKALHFRILRQHGYEVSQDTFNSYKAESGNTFKSCIAKDIKGLLSLYEASFLAFEGEETLDEAQAFAKKHLVEFIKDNATPTLLCKEVSHALELPLHWKVPRVQARLSIDIYEMKNDMNLDLLNFAKLDFNLLQKQCQLDLKHASRWWNDLGLGDVTKSFARDRLLDNFLWTIGTAYGPQYKYCRRQSAQISCLVTTIDDVYDIYGSLAELEVFTDAVERWDSRIVEKLPHCMQICFLAIYNNTNQMVYDIMRVRGVDISSYLQKAWADLCKGYLLEAKWSCNGYKPTLAEYLNNSWITIGGPLSLVVTYLSSTPNITKEALNSLEDYTNLIRYSSIIFRLANDLGPSKDELEGGDVTKSIQCYMHDAGVSKEVAREHIRELVCKIWMKMNKERHVHSPLPQSFLSAAIDLARMAQWMYQNGDGHGAFDKEWKDRVNSLLFKSIPIQVQE